MRWQRPVPCWSRRLLVDPFEPPLPPKIKTRQALRFAKALARGTPRRMKIATTILEDRVKELV